jgi:crotonobetaine/carnitine-CoA ligase
MTRDVGAVVGTLREQLEYQAEIRPTSPFLVTDETTVSWQDMHSRALRSAAGLEAFGVGRTDNVVIALGNRLEFVETWFGLAMLGAVEVPISPELVGDRLVHVFNHSKARVAVVEREFVDKLEQVAEELDLLRLLIVVGEPPASRFESVPYAELARSDHALRPADCATADIAAILYTSGSTGLPKGVMVPYGQHHANGVQGRAAARLSETDVLYLCLPLHHNMAQGYAIWPALLTGCKVRLVERFDRSRFWADVRESRATVWPFVGSLLALLSAAHERIEDADNPLRVAYGVPIPAALHREFERRFRLTLVHGYGSTEATIPVWADADCPPGAAGHVIDGYQVSIRSDEGDALPADSVGEICVRSLDPAGMFAGYYHDPERTASACRDGWFHTSDRGSFDQSGCLWFRGRTGDAIRRFGEFVDADEVENAALTHPDVVNAACFAIADDVAGEEVALAVLLDRGTVSAHQLRQHVSDRLPKFAVPRYVEVVDALPMTATGKVQRFKLKERGVHPAMTDFRANGGTDG